MRTVLIVTYMFPPLSGVGSIRPLKFARYLPEFGWRPVILTVQGGFDWGSGNDPSLLQQLPAEAAVYRARSIEPPYRAVADLAGSDPNQSISLRKRLLRGLRTALLIPDDKIGWLPFALRQGRRILRGETIDAVFSTSPPPTVHLVGCWLSRWAHCPLVIDFRDPWTSHTLHPWLRNPLRRWIEERLEHGVVRRASRIVDVTPSMTEDMVQKYPDIAAGRFVTLTNGFDRADFPPAPPPHNDRFTMVYTGSLYYRGQADSFLQALRNVLADHPELRSVTRLVVAGTAARDVTEQVTALGLADVAELRGPVPYSESLALQRQANLLLMFLWESGMAPRYYTSKLFEYVAVGRPVLAVMPEGIAADLLREAGTGIIIPPGDAAAIEPTLLDLYTRWREGRLPTLVDPNFPNRFERRELTGQLAGLLDAAVAERAGRKR